MRLFIESKDRNAIIVLPTGAGKTLISAAVIAHVFQRVPEVRVLFLVPTCFLVEQQAKALRSETSRNVRELMGGCSAPPICDVLVSTPAAFQALNDLNPANFPLENFGLVIFDEVHHVIKNHPYRGITGRISRYVASGCNIQVLGLTASLTYEMTDVGIKKAVDDLCSALHILEGGILTCKQEELVAGGFHAPINKADLVTEMEARLGTDAVRLDGRSTQSLEIPEGDSKLASFIRHVREEIPPIHPLSIALVSALAATEAAIRVSDAEFVSPICVEKLAEWGVYAQACRTKLAKCKSNMPLIQLYSLLEHLYEAARIVISSSQLSLELGFHYLQMFGILPKDGVSGDADDDDWAKSLPGMAYLRLTWITCQSDICSRLATLADVLLAQIKNFGTSLRCIIFVQQRIATHILKHFIETHPDPALRKLKCGPIYATSSSATASLSINPTQSHKTVAAFSRGDITVLVATSVAEEGYDVPAANCVIRFDAVQNPVSMVQSRGRARQEGSSFVIMSETKKRPFADFEKSEEHQRNLIVSVLAPCQSFRCPICKVPLDVNCESSHFNGRLHKKRARLLGMSEYAAVAMKAEPVVQGVTENEVALLPIPTQSFRCPICAVPLDVNNQWSHFNGRSHKHKAKSLGMSEYAAVAMQAVPI